MTLKTVLFACSDLFLITRLMYSVNFNRIKAKMTMKHEHLTSFVNCVVKQENKNWNGICFINTKLLSSFTLPGQNKSLDLTEQVGKSTAAINMFQLVSNVTLTKAVSSFHSLNNNAINNINN